MTEESKSSTTNIIIICIMSSIIGGLIIYYLLKSRITVASLQQQNQKPTQIDNLAIENRLQNIEQRLQQLHQSNVQTQQTPIINNTYKNNEIRKYIRDDKGRIQSTQIIRDAKIS